MASVTKLSLEFVDEDGAKMSRSYNYANPSVTGTQVKTLMNSMITNGSIFNTPPAIIKGAYLITTDKNAIDLD